MNQLTTIYLVRHGESISNANEEQPYIYHRQWGDTEAPLTPFGIEQAEKRAKSLQGIKFDVVFSSDLTRAINTAEIIRGQDDIPMYTTPLIRERDVSSYFENHNVKPKEEILEEIRQALNNLDEKGKMNYTHGEDIESAQEAADRLTKFLMDTVSEYPGKTILVVCHGNLIRCFLTSIGFAKYNELPLGAIKNTGFIVLESDGEHFTVKHTEGVHRRENAIRDV